MKPRNLMILEDHPLVRDAMAALLVPQLQDMQVVYAGDSLDEAEAAVREQGADLAILDLDLGDRRSPVANVVSVLEMGVPVLVVSALGDRPTIRACMEAGALGFVSKQARPSEILEAIMGALDGEPPLSPEVAAALLESARSTQFSSQERRAMVLYASGLKMESVARSMKVSRSTAQEYIKRVRVKAKRAGTPLPTKTDMYRLAQREGMLP